MKFKVKEDVFSMGKFHRKGTEIEINPKYEIYYQGKIEPIEEKVKSSGNTRRRKNSSKGDNNSI